LFTEQNPDPCNSTLYAKVVSWEFKRGFLELESLPNGIVEALRAETPSGQIIFL